MKLKKLLVVLVGILLFVGCQNNSNDLKTEEVRKIAKEAYLYGFPLVMNYKTLYANAIDKNSGDYKGDFNQKSCEARLFTPEDKAIVTPNSDTPYCMFWTDIRDEPVIFTVPEVEPNRYYSFQFIDLYTHNFAYVGTLTKGNKAGKYMIATSNWHGEMPEGIEEVIRCETGMFFTIIRTQLMGPNDIDNVKKIQSEYRLQTLSEYSGKEPVKNEHQDNFPKWIEGEQFTPQAFKYLDAMLQFVTPVEKEKPLMEKLAKLNIGTGNFDIKNFNEATLEAMKLGIEDATKNMEEFVKMNNTDPLASAKAFGTRAFLEKSAKENYNFDNIYLIRAVAAQMGIYGNSGEEAVYPLFVIDSEGQPLNASENKYTLTFKANEFPPVKAFWSLTMYDGKTQLLIDNPINRYLLNSTMINSFKMNEDGSLTFYVQKDSPGKDLDSNWLPAPNGPFYCIMRLYGPKDEVLGGKWVNPKMVKQIGKI